VYTSVGNFFFYKFTWALNVFMWGKYNVNYISVLQLNNIKTNVMQIMNQVASYILLFFVNVLLYYHANCPGNPLYNTSLRYACPVILLVSVAIFAAYEATQKAHKRQSLGIFSPRMLNTFLLAPFVDATFRDIYAADTLTSFTKVCSLIFHGYSAE
jgi:hypothetical protein